MKFEMLLDFDMQLVADYTGDIVNGYKVSEVRINGSVVELTKKQMKELYGVIHEEDLFFHEEELFLLNE
jgi:hypothetical protein